MINKKRLKISKG